MADDIKARLRDYAENGTRPWIGIKAAFLTSADHIEALEAHNQRLLQALKEAREALAPFAACCEQIADDEDDEEWAKFRLLIQNYRCAAQALAKIDEAGGAG